MKDIDKEQVDVIMRVCQKRSCGLQREEVNSRDTQVHRREYAVRRIRRTFSRSAPIDTYSNGIIERDPSNGPSDQRYSQSSNDLLR